MLGSSVVKDRARYRRSDSEGNTVFPLRSIPLNHSGDFNGPVEGVG
jgi:hypothetical protein